MRRREFVTLIGGTAWPFAARAQQTADKMRRVGILSANFEEDPLGKRAVATFLARLQQLGWAEGRNLQVTVRFAGPDIERMRIAAREIVGLQPDLILAPVTPLVLAVARETSSIPIVFTAASDPTATGFVTNLAHPGGNITGFTALESTMGGKWLQMISEIAPHVARAGLLFNIAMAPNAPLFMRSIQAVASSSAIEATALPVGNLPDMERTIREWAASPNVALVVMTDMFVIGYRKRIIDLAAELRLPTIYPYRFFVTDGGLISYGVPTAELTVAAATYADRIFRGEKPGDLPIQQPNRYELVINLKTARALGVTVSPTLLAQADDLIE
jgi:putative ABC transport system substrate-binding protein